MRWSCGVAGVLMLPPFYYKDNPDEALFASFDEVIQRVGTEAFDLYLYHFPRLSGVPITPGLIERLLAPLSGHAQGRQGQLGRLEQHPDADRALPRARDLPRRRDPAAAGARGRRCGLHQRVLQRQHARDPQALRRLRAPASRGSASSRRRSPPCARSCSCGR